MNKMFTQLKSAVLLWLPMLLIPYLGAAQCGTTFYDAGGPSGNYPANDNSSWTFCPDNPGSEVVEVTFVSFNVETNWDKLYVYDGPDNTYPQISSGNGAGSGPCTQTGGFWGTNIPGPFTATDPSGCLTFEFCSDGSIQLSGWEANVECVPAPSCFAPIISVTENARDCETFTFSVDITLEQQGFPEIIPSLLASVTSNGSAVPGTGGIFANQPGNTFTVGNLPLDQDLTINLQLLGTECSVSADVSAISNGCPIPLECGVPLDQSYCYANNDTLPFLYVSPDGEPVTLFFEGGLLQSCCDFISIYDGEDETGELLFSGNNDGNLNGVGAVAESGALFMRVSSNASVSCASGSTIAGQWNWFVGCGIDIEGCTDPEALNYLPVATLDNGSCLTDGQDCENAALVDALPYVNSGNTSAFGNDYSSADVPQQVPGGAVATGVSNNNYLNGPEAVFKYSPSEDGFIDVSVVGSATSAGLWVFTGCPFELLAGYHTEVTGGAGRFIEALPVFAGTDYYVVISSTNTSQAFNLTISNTEFDCPEFNANEGELCPVGDNFAVLDEDCNCEEIEFDGCTNGTQIGSLLVPPCSGVPVAQLSAFVNSYSTVLVQNGGVYTFNTGSNDNIDLFYLTITSGDGSEILAASPGQVVWQSTFDGNVRFYTHGAADCEGDVTGAASNHQRSVWADCENLVTDCPELEANIGDFCEENGESGTVNADCDCEIAVFEGCTDGALSSVIFNPECSGNVAQQSGVEIGTYNRVNVDNGAIYELNTTPNDFVSALYITITDEAGEEVLATGVNSMNWTSSLTGQVRFYTHGGFDCTSPFSGSVTAHSRSITAVDCENLIFDCQELELDFGAFCDQDNGDLGTVTEDCDCGELVFPGCTNGNQFGSRTANCDTPQDVINASTSQYTSVSNILNNGTYTFSTSENATIPVFYVTLTNSTGSEILASGVAPLTWVATSNTSVRFYTHSTPDCTGGITGGASSHTRTITADCSTVTPECEELGLNIGDACDDGNPQSILETVTADCECIGIIPPSGGTCSDPIAVDMLPFNDEDNTSAYLNSSGIDDLPGNSVNVVGTGSGSGLHLNGNDVVYAYTPSVNQLIDIEVTDHAVRTGLWAFTGCPYSSTVGYHTSSDAGGRLIEAMPVVAGVTYYIVISTWPDPVSTDYNLTISESEIVPDCPNLNANFGEGCDDGDPATINDEISEDCNCEGQPLPLTNCGEYSSAPATVFGGNFGQPSLISDELEISETGENVFNLNVVVEIDHTFTAEVRVRLISPSGTEVSLLNSGNCGGGQNIEVLFDDAAETPSCNSGSTPVLQGYYAPVDELAALSGEPFDGTWTLQVTDVFPFANGGTLKSWCMIPTFESEVEEFSVFELIQNSEVHNTLETAVVAAGLDGVLSSPSSDLTVFAPTDDAFDNLPEGVLAALLDDPDGLLADVLLSHVTAGSVLSTDLADGQTIEMLFGDDVTVTVSNGSIFVNDAEIIVANLLANNGVVHVIDAVLTDIEIETNTVVDFIANSPDHNVLTLALTEAGLNETLSGAGPFTVFAPTDEAFDALPTGFLNDLLDDPTGLLTDFLSYHVSTSELLAEDLTDGLFVQTLLGPSVTITIDDQGTIFVNDAQITIADNQTDNGVVHVIDVVLDPTTLPTQTVLEIIQESEVHNTLETAINAAELGSTLSGSGPFTVFAPTDEAFDALAPGVLNDLLSDPEGDLTEVLLYHIVGQNLPSSSLGDGQELVTLNNGQTVTISVSDGDIFINDAQVIIADLLATNGVVHVIEAVLIPEFDEPGLPTIFEIVEESEVHETLEAAILAAELDGTLSSEGPFTLFAPTDDAFAALEPGVLQDLLDDPSGALTDVLLYHVVNGAVASGDLTDGQVITTLLADGTATVTISEDGIFINDAEVIIADLQASNGIVHVIDAVLIPEEDPGLPTIFEIIQDSPTHATAESAIVAAGLDGTLSNDGPFTVFAPTDAAFAGLPDGVLDALLDDPTGELTDILFYHIVNGTALSTDLTDGQVIETLLAGESITITISEDGIFINDAEVVLADQIASNGVVHIIDAVLIPEPAPVLPTIFEIVEESEVHETLETALVAAELDETLSGDGPFTLFAPTDDAFAALDQDVLNDLLADPTGDLASILLYHVVNGETLSDALSDGQVIQTLLGQSVTVTINADGIFINDAEVMIADLEASNGVVHVIDAVLMPNLTPSTECEAATNVTGAPTFAESEVFTSMAGETASGVEQCQNNNNVQPDQWFSFESIATVMYVRAWGLEDFDAAVEVYEECGGELLACQNTAPAGDREIVIIQNTTPGETYYFRVYHGGAGTPTNLDYSVSVAHIPFTKLREEDCEVFDYTPADVIRTELPPNQFLLANWYFEFTENEAPFNTYEILSPNGSNPNFRLEWFPQAEYGRTYSVRTRARMYQGPNWGDYGDACDIGFSPNALTTQLIESQALGFYNMCDVLEADNVPGAEGYRWRFLDGFDIIVVTTPSRFLQLEDVPGLNLGSPYAVRIRARSLGQWSQVGAIRLIAMNNFVPETGVDANITPCDATYPLTQVLSAVEICAAEFYTWRFTNISNPDQEDLLYTRNDGLRTISLSWVTGLNPGDTYAVQVRAGSGGLSNDYGYSCNITIAGGTSGFIDQPVETSTDVSNAEINMYPNPNIGDEVMISITNLSDDMHDIIIEVYDIYGKKVHSENVANSGSSMNAAVNFHKPMAAGVYTVNIISNEQVIGARKLVVQK